MGGGGFAGRERLNLKFRKSKKSADSENQKSEKSPEQNLYLEKNSNSKKSEKSSYEKKLKFSKIALRNFQKNRNPKTFQKFLAQKNLLKKFLKQKFYRLKFLHKFHSRFFENSSGTILIEFAFCVPVLILLLLYINDIMILARTQDEMKRAAYCAVQLIQNVSKNRVDKKITKKDLQNITRAWTIMVPVAQKSIKENKINVETTIIFVEGIGNNECEVRWMAVAYFSRGLKNWNYQSLKDSATCEWGSCAFSTARGKSGKLNQKLTSTYLYDDFHIKTGERKVIIELCFEDWDASGAMTKELLNLAILKMPIFFLKTTGDHCISFSTHIIFTPINGIFDENTPPK